MAAENAKIETSDSTASRGADCHGCSICGDATPPPAGPYSGGRLALLSSVMFVCPILLAIAGAMLAGQQGTRQLLGAVIGLLAGMALGVITERWLRSKTKVCDEHQ